MAIPCLYQNTTQASRIFRKLTATSSWRALLWIKYRRESDIIFSVPSTQAYQKIQLAQRFTPRFFINNIRTVVGIVARYREEKHLHHRIPDRNQKPFTDALASKNGLTLSHCQGTDMVKILPPLQVGLNRCKLVNTPDLPITGEDKDLALQPEWVRRWALIIIPTEVNLIGQKRHCACITYFRTSLLPELGFFYNL